MKFQNTNPTHELNFNVLGKDYKVPVGGEVEIEPAHVPYVISRGVALEPVTRKSASPKAPAPEAKPAAAKPTVTVATQPVKPSE